MAYLRRIALASAISGLVLGLGLVAGGLESWGAGVIAGDLWAIANLYCVRFVLVRWLRPTGEAAGSASLGLWIGALVKFPVLYGLGYLMLRSGWFRTEGLVLGFIVPFAVAFADALGQFAAERRQAATR
jgi:hypothetical protein